MVKTVGNGLDSLNAKTNWRVESTIAWSKKWHTNHSVTFTTSPMKQVIFFKINEIFNPS